MSKINMPKRGQTVNMPKRQKAIEEMNPNERLELQKTQSKMAQKVEDMSDEVKRCIGVYGHLSNSAAARFGHARFGKGATLESGYEIYEEVVQSMTEIPIRKSNGEMPVDELFALLGAAAGYQAGLALGKNNQNLDEDMVRGAMSIIEGGFRLMVTSAQEVAKNKILKVAQKKIH